MKHEEAQKEKQSLIRTAEQLKIKGLCEINDHTNATESDTEVIYPPHKKIRASRNYDSNNSLSSNNRFLSAREETCTLAKGSSQSTTNLTEKDAHQQSIASQEDPTNTKNKSKSPAKESKNSSSNSNNQQKNMASLDMGMVSESITGIRCFCRCTCGPPTVNISDTLDTIPLYTTIRISI